MRHNFSKKDWVAVTVFCIIILFFLSYLILNLSNTSKNPNEKIIEGSQGFRADPMLWHVRDIPLTPIKLHLPPGTLVSGNFISYFDMDQSDTPTFFSVSFHPIAEGKDVKNIAQDFFCNIPIFLKEVPLKENFMEIWQCYDLQYKSGIMEHFYVIKTKDKDQYLAYPYGFESLRGRELLEDILQKAIIQEHAKTSITQANYECIIPKNIKLKMCSNNNKIEHIAATSEENGQLIQMGAYVFSVTVIYGSEVISLNANCPTGDCTQNATLAFDELYEGFINGQSVTIQGERGYGRYVLHDNEFIKVYHRDRGGNREFITFIDKKMIVLSAERKSLIDAILLDILMKDFIIQSVNSNNGSDISDNWQFFDVPSLPISLKLPELHSLFPSSDESGIAGITVAAQITENAIEKTGNYFKIFFANECKENSECENHFKKIILRGRSIANYQGKDSNISIVAYWWMGREHGNVLFEIQIGNKKIYAAYEHQDFFETLPAAWETLKNLLPRRIADTASKLELDEQEKTLNPHTRIPPTWIKRTISGTNLQILLPEKATIKIIQGETVQKESLVQGRDTSQKILNKITQYEIKIEPWNDLVSPISIIIYIGDIEAFEKESSWYTFGCPFGHLPVTRVFYYPPQPCGDGYAMVTQDENTRYIVGVFGNPPLAIKNIITSIAKEFPLYK